MAEWKPIETAPLEVYLLPAALRQIVDRVLEAASIPSGEVNG